MVDVDEIAPPEGSAEESDLIKQLRKALKDKDAELKAKDARIATLEQKNTASVLQEVGLDPESEAATGLLRLHEDGELTADALRATAARFQIGVPAAGAAPGSAPATDVTAAAVAATANAAGLLGASTGPALPPDLDQRIAQAEADGNVSLAIELKMQRANGAPVR